MIFRARARAEGSVDLYGKRGEKRLDDERVAHHADIRAGTDEFDLREILEKSPIERTESGLVENGRVFKFECVRDLGYDLPTARIFDAMNDRKAFAFGCGKIVLSVRIAGSEHRAAETVDPLYDGHDDRLCGGVGERAAHEVLLHIDDDECFFHSVTSFFLFFFLETRRTSA